MSKKNTVNRDRHNVGGRDRQDDKMAQAIDSGKRYPAKKHAGSGFTTAVAGRSARKTGNTAGRRQAAKTGRTPADAEALDLGRAVNRNATAGRRSRGDWPKDESAPAKRGQGSTAVKRATTRHGTSPLPAAQPVAGAFGKQGGLSETESIVDKEPHDNPEEGDDFLTVRRKENKRARK